MASRLSVSVLTSAGTLFGIWVAYRWPSAPVLAYWIALAVALGVSVSVFPGIGGFERRLRWLVSIYAVLIGASLVTTQVAARRAISSTHLVYRGVHLVGTGSFTIGSGGSGAEVRLESAPSVHIPWSLRVHHTNAGWDLEPLSGIEQLRIREGSTRPIEHDFSVARSALLQPGHAVDLIDPGNAVVDRLRLVRDGIEMESGARFDFAPVDDRLSARYQRRLIRGSSLAALDGNHSDVSAAYERFVRVQEISSRDVVNGDSVPLLLRPFAPKRYLVSAAPPYTLRGDSVRPSDVTLHDRAFVDVRNGDISWRFVLIPDWRREPSAPRGVAIFFHRNPKPLDTPLPVGLSCETGAACGAISIRRLPPPVAHVALDNAGFDPERFGLLGMLRLARDGYEVVLPRETFYVQRGTSRPVAIPVTPLEPAARDRAVTRDGESRWILLEAVGDRDDAVKVVLIGVGLALLFLSLQSAMRMVTIGDPAKLTIGQMRGIGVGLTALLSLILTRVTIGARVAFFDPFLDRGIETAVGLCTAIAVVIVGLLTWSSWVPPLLAAGHDAFAGQLTLRRIAGKLLRGFAPARPTPEAGRTAIIALSSFVLLTIYTGSAPLQGMITGGVVLLVWLCVSWVAAFTGHQFDTFEGGAHSLIEQSSPPSISHAKQPLRLHIPDVSVMGAFGLLTIMHSLPRFGLVASVIALVAAAALISIRRHRSTRICQPDYAAAGIGVLGFGGCLSCLRIGSENGSLGLMVLVVFAALSSVRIGRGIGARLDVRARVGGDIHRREWLADAGLLAAPLVLLAPLATVDMGLALVLVIPLAFATIIATGWRSVGLRLVVPFAAMSLLCLLVLKVVFPSMTPIRSGDSHVEQAAAFARMSMIGGFRIPGISTPMDRAAARAVATYDQPLAEALLVAAGPGPARDLLLPSIEQVWGAKAYASSGMWGAGLGRAVIGGRGVAEAVSYAENTFAVFVLAEHGTVGGVLILTLYALLIGAVATITLGRATSMPSYRASRALFLIGVLVLAVPACYVALSNLGKVPITGQNMPFLGLNAWSDVAVCSGVIGILVTGTLRALQEEHR